MAVASAFTALVILSGATPAAVAISAIERPPANSRRSSAGSMPMVVAASVTARDRSPRSSRRPGSVSEGGHLRSGGE